MATRIEFSKHGGPEVLQAVEFTPRDPSEHEIQVACIHLIAPQGIEIKSRY